MEGMYQPIFTQIYCSQYCVVWRILAFDGYRLFNIWLWVAPARGEPLVRAPSDWTLSPHFSAPPSGYFSPFWCLVDFVFDSPWTILLSTIIPLFIYVCIYIYIFLYEIYLT
jgi:hypothetical protein